jgi:hypothetical protein
MRKMALTSRISAPRTSCWEGVTVLGKILMVGCRFQAVLNTFNMEVNNKAFQILLLSSPLAPHANRGQSVVIDAKTFAFRTIIDKGRSKRKERINAQVLFVCFSRPSPREFSQPRTSDAAQEETRQLLRGCRRSRGAGIL